MNARELRDAATENFIVHGSWAARRMPGVLVESTPSLTMVDSGLSSDTFNLVCGARLRPIEVPETAHRIVEHFRSAARPFAWWVSPGDEPGDLAPRLRESGLEEQETELAMALSLADASSAPGLPEVVEIREAATVGDIAAFARVNAENWDPPDAAVESFYGKASSSLLAGESPQKIFVARQDGKPVAAIELTMAGGVGGIYNLSTRRAHRRRGIGGALLERACRRARDLGARSVVLQASSAGASLYRSFGFVEFGLIREFKPSQA